VRWELNLFLIIFMYTMFHFPALYLVSNLTHLYLKDERALPGNPPKKEYFLSLPLLHPLTFSLLSLSPFRGIEFQ
jgi:hypothetical protein